MLQRYSLKDAVALLRCYVHKGSNQSERATLLAIFDGFLGDLMTEVSKAGRNTKQLFFTPLLHLINALLGFPP
jgi:hypothetical protein